MTITPEELEEMKRYKPGNASEDFDICDLWLPCFIEEVESLQGIVKTSLEDRAAAMDEVGRLEDLLQKAEVMAKLYTKTVSSETFKTNVYQATLSFLTELKKYQNKI